LNPNKQIFNLLIANGLNPGDIIIDNLMDNIPSWEPIWVDIINLRETVPPYFDVDRHHQFDKQAHLYLAKRFPNYITRKELDKIFLNNEDANAEEIISILTRKMPRITEVKRA
jgi:hypothetical protein